jgi:preprotein translocase subunit SecG
MLTTLLFTVIILVISVLLSIKVLLKKGGRFPNTHIEGNRALGKKGIFCAKTMDRMAVKQKGLYDIMNEIKE